MVSLEEVRTHNTSLSSTLPPHFVAVFVGGTSGIGLSTARELVRNTQSQSPHIYLVGRSSTAASNIINEFTTLNPSAQTTFIQSDVSLLKNVDDVCRQIVQREQKVNLLFMTPGYATTNWNRDDTPEGLDRKFTLHYYTRMRFISNLPPLLSSAGSAATPIPTASPTSSTDSPSKTPPTRANISRVISVLDSKTGRSANPDFNDLGLQNPGAFGLKSCADHACSMTSFAFEHWSQALPSTSFIHSYPHAVDTNVGRDLSPAVGGAGAGGKKCGHG